MKKESKHPFLATKASNQRDVPFVFVNGREINFLYEDFTEENLKEVIWCHSSENEETIKQIKTYS